MAYAWKRSVNAAVLVAAAGMALMAPTAAAQDAELSDEMQAEVDRFNDHLVTLASPWMEGRVPGSDGMERAKDYVEYYFRAFGLTPAFPSEIEGEMTDFSSYRDPFELGGTWEIEEEKMSAVSARGELKLTGDEDFVYTALGGSGDASGRAVFVGYSIENGPDDWTSFGEDDDLTGKVAIMLRFEPMDEDGKSLWSDGDGWSNTASFNNKLKAVADRGADAVVIINPGQAADRRIERLNRFSSGGGAGNAPVFMVNPESGEELLGLLDGEGRSMDDFMELANEGGGVLELDGLMTLRGEAEKNPLTAENVGAVIPGVGDLADEYVVIGAHLDHLGMGYFGSRSGPGELHPGADDNASGSGGVLLLAEKLVATFAEMDEDAPRRSVLLMCFSAEESGLNGARHYVQDPIVPMEQHSIMINWDMIGRIENDRLLVAGGQTGDGLQDWLQPYLDESDLECVVPEQMSGASDHTAFYMSDTPVLFSIIADFHGDYHTPADTSDKINRVGAVKTVRMYHDIVRDLTTMEGRFEHVSPQQLRSRGEQGAGGAAVAPAGGINVRVGVTPGSYDKSESGIPISNVAEGSPAAEAGIESGDSLLRWDGQKLTSVEDWMRLLVEAEPGDVVKIGVLRDGEEVTLEITLGSK